MTVTLADVQGHWRRDWLKAPGVFDATTQVHWVQAGEVFADIRIPAGFAGPQGAASLAEMDQPALGGLMRAEGFAGLTSVENGRCTWNRQINWHGFPTDADVGDLWFDEAGCLIEDGVHAEYREQWRRVEGGDYRSVRREGPDGLEVAIWNDVWFILACGVEGAPAMPGLADRLSAGTAGAEEVARQFGSFYGLGRWDGEAGIVTMATDPTRIGRAILARDGTQTVRLV